MAQSTTDSNLRGIPAFGERTSGRGDDVTDPRSRPGVKN